MKKIAFIDVVHPVLREGLEGSGFKCVDLALVSKENIIRSISEYEGIVVRSRFPMDKDFLSKAVKLEFIARSGSGVENIDVDYCNSNGIVLFNAPEGNRNAVAEHALGMLLSLFNNICKGNAEIHNGQWKREDNRGVELDGKVVGIIGYGNNGSCFAKKLSGFDVTVLAYDKYKTGFGNSYVKESTMSEIYAKADIVSLHIPQTAETISLVNNEFISRFQKDIYLINLSRGKIVETKALVRGLKENKVLGACLDVLEYEKSSFETLFTNKKVIPEAFQFILKSEKVLLSPHVGGWTIESYFQLGSVLLNKIKQHYKT